MPTTLDAEQTTAQNTEQTTHWKVMTNIHAGRAAAKGRLQPGAGPEGSDLCFDGVLQLMGVDLAALRVEHYGHRKPVQKLQAKPSVPSLQGPPLHNLQR